MKTFPAEELNLDSLMLKFNSEKHAIAYLEQIRWPDGPVCPHCRATDKLWKLKANPKTDIPEGQWECGHCNRQFTLRKGTIFENSKIPLRKWLLAWYLMCSSKKGVSSLQLKRQLKLGSYNTALYMTHRIRYALKHNSFTRQLEGIVEADKGIIGGVVKNKGKGSRDNKSYILSVVERGGEVRTLVLNKAQSGQVLDHIRTNVKKHSTMVTDMGKDFTYLTQDYDHHWIRHAFASSLYRKDGELPVHTFTVDGYFGLVKRGIYGIYHSVSQKRLPLYLAEFDHRYTHRKVSDGERTVKALQFAPGKRLFKRRRENPQEASMGWK